MTPFGSDITDYVSFAEAQRHVILGNNVTRLTVLGNNVTPLTVLGKGTVTRTGGKGTLTQWVHCEFIVSFEAICPVITQQVCGEFS